MAPPGDNDRSEYHTHCIALGPKSGDHSAAVDHILQELEGIRKGKWRYYAYEDRMVYTSFDIIAYLSDRPERSEITQTLDHSGNTSKRSRYVACIDDGLPSCDKCFKLLLEEALCLDGGEGNSSCRNCCNWDYDSTGSHAEAWKKSSSVSAHYGQNYPSGVSAAGNDLPIPANRSVPAEHIPPQEQEFQWLEQGCTFALHELTYNYGQDGWLKTNACNYLGTMGVRTSLQQKIWEEASQKREAMCNGGGGVDMMEGEEAENPNHMEDEEADADPEASAEDPGTSLLPKIWSSGYNLKMFLDCPMHLIFLGIVGTILRDVFPQFLKSHSHETS